MCGSYGGGGVHHSLWPRGAENPLAFTCIKSECPGHRRRGRGEGGGGSRVSNDWFISDISIRGKNGVYGTRIWYSSYASIVQS